MVGDAVLGAEDSLMGDSVNKEGDLVKINTLGSCEGTSVENTFPADG